MLTYLVIIMSQGLGLRSGVIDGAISISAVQVYFLNYLIIYFFTHYGDVILCNVHYIDHSLFLGSILLRFLFHRAIS